MAVKTDNITDNVVEAHKAIERMKVEYTAAGWKVVNEEAGAIALSKPAYYIGSPLDKQKVTTTHPRTLVNWLLGRA